MQYLKRIHPTTQHVLERFALLICIAVVWAFAAILTVAGAYNTSKNQTQQSCRTDRSYLMTSAPWYVLKVVDLSIQQFVRVQMLFPEFYYNKYVFFF